MDHTHKLSGSSIVDICIIQVSYMNGSGLMLIDTCIILLLESPCSLVGSLVGSLVRNEKNPHHRYTHQGHRSQIYASFIPASYTHASGSRIIYIKLLWIHASCIHASYIHASGSRIKNIYTSYVHTYLRVKAQPNRYMHHTFMHQSYIYVHHRYVHPTPRIALSVGSFVRDKISAAL